MQNMSTIIHYPSSLSAFPKGKIHFSTRKMPHISLQPQEKNEVTSFTNAEREGFFFLCVCALFHPLLVT